MCHTFIGLAAQVCLHQQHHKHMSNALRYDVMVATMSLGNKNVLAPCLQSYGTTVIYAVHYWLKCYIAHDCMYVSLPLFICLLSAIQSISTIFGLLTIVLIPKVTQEECLALGRYSWKTNKQNLLNEWLNSILLLVIMCPWTVYLTSLGLGFFICIMRILVTYLWINACKMSTIVTA